MKTLWRMRGVQSNKRSCYFVTPSIKELSIVIKCNIITYTRDHEFKKIIMCIVM
uniref:Uncharacterized protein n=1 Tax=Lepeophtheirus salmonis TaxID=72036 RepID=A0A0K2T380_LEPSM